MSWTLDVAQNVAVVVMQSNPVNKMNPQFFDDLHDTFDRLDRDHPRLPVVLTAEGKTFSAGLDFEDVFPRFAGGDEKALTDWFFRFRSSIVRVFSCPRRIVAAINGNAFAGGLILAVACDVRLAAHGAARFAINEVPVGIPMPGVYTEIVRHAVGTAVAQEAILGGQVFDLEQSRAMGFVHRVVPVDQLLQEAVKAAAVITPDCFAAYATSKRALQYPALRVIEGEEGAALDRAAIDAIRDPGSIRAQAAALARLKRKV